MGEWIARPGAHVYGRECLTRRGERRDRGKAAQSIAPLEWTTKGKIDGGWRKSREKGKMDARCMKFFRPKIGRCLEKGYFLAAMRINILQRSKMKSNYSMLRPFLEK